MNVVAAIQSRVVLDEELRPLHASSRLEERFRNVGLGIPRAPQYVQ
jgi:hypothetical protein